MNSPLLRPWAVAKILDVSEQTVRNLASAGHLRAVTFKTRGDRWTLRFREQDIEEFLNANLREGRGIAG